MNAIKSAKFVQKNLYFRQRVKDTIEYQIAHIVSVVVPVVLK